MPTCETCVTQPATASTLDISGIECSTPGDWPPDRVGKALLRWLRYHFGAADRPTRPSLRGYVWTDDPSSPIQIDTLAAYKPASDGTRPALLVETGRQSEDPSARGIGFRRQGGPSNGPQYTIYAMTGVHAIFCIGGREGEVLELAREVFEEATAFCGVVGERLGLRRFYPSAQSERKRMPEHKDTWTVMVSFGYDYDLSQVVRPAAAPQLRDTFLALADPATT